jgi:hypothetical protein
MRKIDANPSRGLRSVFELTSGDRPGQVREGEIAMINTARCHELAGDHQQHAQRDGARVSCCARSFATSFTFQITSDAGTGRKFSMAASMRSGPKSKHYRKTAADQNQEPRYV